MLTSSLVRIFYRSGISTETSSSTFSFFLLLKSVVFGEEDLLQEYILPVQSTTNRTIQSESYCAVFYVGSYCHQDGSPDSLNGPAGRSISSTGQFCSLCGPTTACPGCTGSSGDGVTVQNFRQCPDVSRPAWNDEWCDGQCMDVECDDLPKTREWCGGAFPKGCREAGTGWNPNGPGH